MSTGLSLYRVEENLLALLDTEELVAPDLEAQWLADLNHALSEAEDKREAFGQFLLWLDSQEEAGKKEIERLKRRNETIANAARKLKRYAIDIIKSWGVDKKGKYRKLTGHTVTMWARALPASVDILDEALVPDEFKIAHVRMPMPRWMRLVQANPGLAAEATLNLITIPKEPLEKELLAGRHIDGVDMKLSGHDHSLVVK